MLYSPQGASVLNGIQAGQFFVPASNINPGVSIGNTLLKPLRFFNSDTLWTQSIPANSIAYIKLASLEAPTNADKKAATVVYDSSSSYVQMTSPTALGISSSGSINCFISGEDQYDEKMTWGNDPSTPITAENSPFFMSRCLSKVRSIKITNLSGSATTVTIKAGSYIELPFYNFGTGAHITNLYSGTNTYLEALSAPSPDPVPVQRTFKITNPTANPLVNGLTLSTGTVRPFIYWENADGDNIDFPDFAVPISAFVEQAVFGFGTLPDWVDASLKTTLMNSKLSIIGGKQYAENYIGWQG